MPQNFDPFHQPPLSAGNVVTAGIQLYRSQFRRYFTLSTIAHLWLIIPIYGWAKYSAVSALIAKLIFNQFTNQPQEISRDRQSVNTRKWNFLTTSFLVIFRCVLVGFFATLVAMFLGRLLFAILIFLTNDQLGFRSNQALFEWSGMFITVLLLLFIVISMILTYAPTFTTELPLILESKVGPIYAIKRCLKLSKGSIYKILGVITASTAIALLLPLTAIAIIEGLLGYLLKLAKINFQTSDILELFYLLFIGGAINTFFLPFWQAVKAILYFDFLNQQEGLGLQLRRKSM